MILHERTTRMHHYNLSFDRFKLELGSQICIMGILNVTPDSFSDGGRFNSLETAVAQGIKLVEDGADILDIGGESSRPFAAGVSEKEEIERVVPAIEVLARQIDIPISIDTTKVEVARAALNAGAAIINDISAFENNPSMAALAAKNRIPVVLMHMKGTPKTMQVNPDYGDLMSEITQYLKQRAEFAMQNGISKENIILDPGIGFGKTIHHNLIIIKQLQTIADLDFPVLIGTSRKSFIQKIIGLNPTTEQIEYGTLATLAASSFHGANIVRVHDVEKASSFLKMINAIKNA